MNSNEKPPMPDGSDFPALLAETESLLAETEHVVEEALEPLFDEEAGLLQLRQRINGQRGASGAPQTAASAGTGARFESRRSSRENGGSDNESQGSVDSANRYDFPSAPSLRRQPYPSQGPQSPGPSPYEQPPAPRIQPVQPQRRYPEPSPAAASNNPLVRPYAMTGGRTRPRYQLAIEALVHTTAQPHQMQGQLPEHQRICNLCREIKSIAEISALLTIPLGVARILVADLAEAGLVAVHRTAGEADGNRPDVAILERVLSGLRKL